MTSAIIRSRAAERAHNKSVYLVNPFFDYTFVCGGLALALSAIALSTQIPANSLVQSSTPVILLGVLGTYLFSEPHSAATIFRLYGEANNRKRFAFVAYVLPLILAACFIGALYVPVIAKIMAVLYLIFITHHIMAQSFGIAMIYCARDGFNMSRADKNGMKALIYSAVTLSVAQQFTTAWQREHFLGIDMPPMGFLPPQLINMLQTMVILTVILFAIDLAIKHAKGIRHIPLPAVATLMTGTLALSINRSTSEVVWLFIPAFFHASQYMCVVFAYKLKRETKQKQDAVAVPDESDRMLKNMEFLGGHFVECFLVGLLIFAALPFALAACGLSLTLCSALIFLAVNLHHFAADACIWKLKDPSVRSRLIL
ncbi:MAG: hypothetical protein KGS72_24635 [Cyanobacteria bacterium REEB67]|nr:hypothetical protein [Cyanobacteria bacterium REEB67]